MYIEDTCGVLWSKLLSDDTELLTMQFSIQTVSSLNNLDHNSSHVSSMCITPRTPENSY
jgi:hypothetical protein